MDPGTFESVEAPEYNWKTPTYMYLLLLTDDLIDTKLYVNDVVWF